MSPLLDIRAVMIAASWRLAISSVVAEGLVGTWEDAARTAPGF